MKPIKKPFASNATGRILTTVLVFGILSVLFLFPLVRLVLTAFSRDGIFTTANILEIVRNDSNLKALGNSLLLGLAVTAIAVPLALILSWLVVRTNLYARGFFKAALVVPFFIPPFIMAFAWTRLLGNAGYLNVFLQNLFNLASPPFRIYGAGGVILVSVIYTYPYAFIILSGSIGNIGSHLEEAALISGAKKHRVLRDIVLPVLLPSVASSAMIVFVTTISMFGIPALLGTPGRFIVITTRIYGYVGGFRDPNGIGIATGLSLLLLIIAGIVQGLQALLTRHDRFSTITGKSAPMEPVDLGPFRLLLTFLVGLFVLFAVLGPLAAVAATSVTRALGLPFTSGNLTLDHYGTLMSMGLVRRSFRNSLGLALAVPSLITLASVLLVHLKRNRRIFGYRAIEQAVSIPYAVPGIVIGVAMILTWIRPVLGVSIYNTIWILAVAYIVRFMVFPMNAVESSWKQIDDSLEEAARVSGRSPSGVLRDISIPLLRSGIGSGWLLAFMPALTELTLSILLYSPGNETVGVTAFNIMEEGLVPVAGAYAMAIVAMVLILHALHGALTGTQRRNRNHG